MRVLERTIADELRAEAETIMSVARGPWEDGAGQALGHSAAAMKRIADLLEDRPTLWGRLMEFYTEEEARLWLASPQPLLDGGVPAELLAKGEDERLHAILDALDSGVYL